MRARITFVAAAALSAMMMSCQTEGHLPNEYLGQWYHVATSGGIQGETVEENAPGWIEITAGNEIEHYAEDGTLTATEAFRLSRGSTIYSGDEGWLLSSTPSSPGGVEGFSRAIWVTEGGTLMIADNVYDGFGSAYARERQPQS